MAKVINGEKWYLVDTTYDDCFVYDVYENEQGEHFYDIVDSLY